MTDINSILATLAGIVLCAIYVPYGIDITKGKVKPSRSARIMLASLLLVALLQQHSLGSSWTLAITIGELVGSVGILGLAMKYGIGGLRKLDLLCYGLLSASLTVWVISGSALIALHMTILTDLIAFTPTLIKTWHEPASETPLFFAVGAFAPLLAMVGLSSYDYAIIAFPLYLAVINAFEVALIYRRKGS